MLKISYSFGIVDLLHYGHINALNEANKKADLHIFGLVSDEAAVSWMGNIVSSYSERKKVLESISYVDEIMFQNTLDPVQNLKQIHKKYPHAEITLYHGDDWRIMPAIDYLNTIGGEVVFTKYYEKLHPENIKEILNKRSLETKKYNNLISTKANTLVALKKILNESRIEDIMIFTVEEATKDFDGIFNKVKSFFKGNKIVVRSSTSNEDLFEQSNAGHYESILNVKSGCKKSLFTAITKVINSYKEDLFENLNAEQILIQRQTLNVKVSGVIFTREITENRPYYVINFDDNGSTDSVTSGESGKTIWISHEANIDEIDYIWRKLVCSIKEIQSILEGMVLDIEFAIDANDDVIIFQVRPLAASYKFSPKEIDKSFFNIKDKEKMKYLKMITTDLETQPMMLSDMAFWNPAEIIGSNPKTLDYSLYREIITKRAWNKGLISIGYTKVNQELMYKIGNKPYISIDYSFLSLIPNDLEQSLKMKLVNYYKEKLKKDLTAHDKIEFEIVISCFDLETDFKLQDLCNNGFSKEEVLNLRSSLVNLTEKAYIDYEKILKKDLEHLNKLTVKRNEIQSEMENSKGNYLELVSYFKSLIASIKLDGTPQFSRQARFAFMSNAICKSLISKGYIKQSDLDGFFQFIHTVASEFDKDYKLLLTKQLSRELFNAKYGHLRSGTYDIRTKRYDQSLTEDVNNGFSFVSNETKIVSNDNLIDENIFHEALKMLDFKIDTKQLTKAIKDSIEQREYFKFEFTKSLSLAIEIIALIGVELGINRSSLSYLDISDIYSLENYPSIADAKEFLEAIIMQRRAIHKEKSKLILPEVITTIRDLDFIELKESRPNFITNKVIEGEVAYLESNENIDLLNKIVVITKADPGFDWIFTRGIKGLVTKYGGVASHMAIRCAEFGIPAAIGCGEKIFDYVLGTSRVVLDCKNGKISGGN